ncbi:PilZ domain-containing protein [bacterium]|nr:PilZ domain-containing protein [bacterium]
MLNLKLKERRLNTRRRLTGLLPGKIVDTKKEEDVSCRPVDISKDGIGILTEDQLEQGDILNLMGPDLQVELKVMWKKQDYGKQSLFRYGLVTTDNSVNLENIFMAAGCLK